MRPRALQPPRARLSDPRQAPAPTAHPHAQRGAPLQVPQACCRDLCASPVPGLVPRVLAGHLCSDAVQPDQRPASISFATMSFLPRGLHSREGSCARRRPQNWRFLNGQKAC